MLRLQIEQKKIDTMGAEQPKIQKQPQISLKDKVKNYSKEIAQTRKDFGRAKFDLEYQGKNLHKDLQKKIKEKAPLKAKKQVAQQILRNNQMVGKYDKIDAQLQNVNFQLQQMVANESMQKVMSGITKMMSGASNKMKGSDYTSSIKRFVTQKQRMNAMNEYVEDVMNNDEEQIEDQDVDNMINEMTNQEKKKRLKRLEQDNFDLDSDGKGLDGV